MNCERDEVEYVWKHNSTKVVDSVHLIFVRRTGLLWFFGATEVKNLEIVSDGLKTHNIPYQVFSGSEVR